jgi:hypothetical protein
MAGARARRSSCPQVVQLTVQTPQLPTSGGAERPHRECLNEARILILGGQVLIGVNYRSFFEDDFAKLSVFSQYVLAISLALMLAGLGLLLIPAPYHHLVERHRISEGFHAMLSVLLAIALLPFAVALGADLYVAGEKTLGVPGGAAAGVLGLVTALVCWWGLEIGQRGSGTGEFRLSMLFHPGHGRMPEKSKRESQDPKLSDKVKEVLVETRIVLPGAQALLGFQFIIMLMRGFDVMPAPLKYIHFASLAAIALSTILLIMPAAYHRIVYGGEDRNEFVVLAGRLLLAAMVFLALGVSGDFLVVSHRVTNSMGVSIVAGVLMLALFYGLWFGWTSYQRRTMA